MSERDSAGLMWPALGAAFALGIAAFYPIDNPDTFGHLAAGRQIAALGHVPTLDTFSYFRAQPVAYVNYEWLSDLLLFMTYRVGGYPALNVLKLLLLAVLGGLLVELGRVRAGRVGAWLCLLVLVSDLPGLRFRLSVRPHLFGLVFGALYLLGLSQIMQARRPRDAWLWVAGLAATHVLWVNLHGSHLFGFALLGLAAVCGRMQPGTRLPLFALLGLAVIASCISPYGPSIVTGAIAHVFDPAYREVIDEWQPWRASQPIWYPLMLLWQALWLLVALRGLPRDRLFKLSVASALLLLLMAARSLRFLSDALALTAPIIAIGLTPQLVGGAVEPIPFARWTAARRQRAAIITFALTAIAALLVCLQLPPEGAFGFGVSTRGRPVASAEWLAAHLPDARIFAAMPDSWDMMFTLPEAKFLIDGRTPMYGPEHVRRVQQSWSSAARFRELIDATGTDVVVAQTLLTEQQPAVQALLGFRDFRLVSIEEQHCVFARVEGRRSQLLAGASLHVLRPGYESAWLLAPDARPVVIAGELAKLPTHPNTEPYRSWVHALIALRPLVRAEGRAGVAAPRTAAERAGLDDALRALRATDLALRIVPSVNAYHLLAAIAACQLDEASTVLAHARSEGATREVLFGEQELNLRRGETTAVRAFVARVTALPAAAGDPWIEALQAELTAPPQCP